MEAEARIQFRKALQAAFGTPTSLEMLVEDTLGEPLNHFASKGTHPAMVFELVNQAIAQGKIERLVEGAIRENPGNVELLAFVRAHYPEYVPEEVPPRLPPPPLLSFEDVDFLIATAVRYRCDRSLLLEWINVEVVSHLDEKDAPASQFRSDVRGLLDRSFSGQPESPIYLWVRNLSTSVRPYPEAARVQALRDRLKG